MFNNISDKIKFIARVLCGVGIAVFALGGIGYILSGIENGDTGEAALGFVFLIFGPALSWVWSCMLYGFGQLIENTNSLNGVEVMQDEETDE